MSWGFYDENEKWNIIDKIRNRKETGWRVRNNKYFFMIDRKKKFKSINNAIEFCNKAKWILAKKLILSLETQNEQPTKFEVFEPSMNTTK